MIYSRMSLMEMLLVFEEKSCLVLDDGKVKVIALVSVSLELFEDQLLHWFSLEFFFFSFFFS